MRTRAVFITNTIACVATILGSSGFAPHAVAEECAAPDLFQLRLWDFDWQTGPVDIVDLNADGHADILFTPPLSSQVMFRFGNGDATFQPYHKFDFDAAEHVAAGHADNDGRPDMLVAGRTSAYLLLSNDEHWWNTTEVLTGERPRWGVIDNAIGSSANDLVVFDAVDGELIIARGVGDGTFTDIHRTPIAVDSYVLDSAFLNDDSYIDVVMLDSATRAAYVMLATGDGPYATAVDIAPGVQYRDFAVGDVDGNGTDDLAFVHWSADEIHVYLTDSNGSVAPPLILETGPLPFAVAIGDVDGDGDDDDDIVVNCLDDRSIWLFRGDDDGAFSKAETQTLGFEHHFLELADFNEDGMQDICVSGLLFDFSILLNQGDATYPALQSQPFDAGILAVADVNADTRTDLVVARSESITVYTRLPNGELKQSFQAEGIKSPSRIEHIDLNGDLHDDFVIPGFGDSIAVYISNGDGTLQPQNVYPAGDSPRNVAIDDFNHDSIPDIVIASHHGEHLGIRLGSGDGTLGPQSVYELDERPADVVAGDFNNDGHVDLVVSLPQSGLIRLLCGFGDGTFEDGRSCLNPEFSLGDVPGRMQATDWNEDNNLDVVVIQELNETLAVLTNDGSGSFGLFRTTLGHFGLKDLILGDFNDDGREDIATLNGQGRSVSVFLHTSNHGLEAAHFIVPALSFAAYDENFDGMTDIAVLSGSDVLTTLTNRCTNACPADIANDDHTVNLFDLLSLVQNWNTFSLGAAIAEPADTIDIFDLLAMLDAWGSCQ